MRTAAMRKRIGLSLSDEPLTFTKQLQEQFLDSLKSGGRQTQTIRTYRHSLNELFEFLGPNKEIKRDTLNEWKEHLKEEGYSESTVSIRLTAANGFLRYCGREELASVHGRIVPNEPMPEMTREEYLQFLAKVREIGSDKYYFMVKTFASVDISIGELEFLTIKSCREGFVHLTDEKTALIPACLQQELLEYAGRHGIMDGPIFVTRNGNLIDRANITNSIRRLAARVGMDPGKCSPSALHRVYKTTQRELMNQLLPVYRQSYENLLNTEQTVVGWNK